MSRFRMAVMWCPDWPVVAARAGMTARTSGAANDEPATAVVTANHVVACSPYAREYGVRRGMRRREAQSRCPDLVVLPRDEAAEARCFEPAIVAVETVVAGVEVIRPGLMAVSAPGASRFFGGEPQLIAALRDAAEATVDDLEIGVADGVFAAEQAARRGVVVPPGESAAFLADLPIAALDSFGDSPLVDVLRRLGIRTLGSFAALPAKDVAARFGPLGALAHRQAGGRDGRPVAVREPPADCAIGVDFSPAAERVDVIAFSARSAVETFITDLAARSLTCACVELAVTTANGEQLVRRWRQAGVLTTTDVIDRIRWQLEGRSVSAGVTHLRIAPVEVVPTGTHQQSLWGGDGEAGTRAKRGIARVQTMLGLGGVVAPVLSGGRDPVQRTEFVAYGEDREPARRPDDPWPGRLPSPVPSVVLDPPRPVQVLDAAGRAVVVSDRGSVARPPARLGLGRELPVAVTSWAGPWPVDERWWDPASAARVARIQLVDVRGRAYLVVGEMAVDAEPRWLLEGIYD